MCNFLLRCSLPSTYLFRFDRRRDYTVSVAKMKFFFPSALIVHMNKLTKIRFVYVLYVMYATGLSEATMTFDNVVCFSLSLFIERNSLTSSNAVDSQQMALPHPSLYTQTARIASFTFYISQTRFNWTLFTNDIKLFFLNENEPKWKFCVKKIFIRKKKQFLNVFSINLNWDDFGSSHWLIRNCLLLHLNWISW